MCRREYLPLALILVVLTSFPTFPVVSAPGADCDSIRVRMHDVSYTPHAPIAISSNEDFSAQGWPGAGTIDDPYVIAGLNITSDETCISISGTTAHFEIRDCLISSTYSSSKSGIVLVDVANGVVRNNIVERHYDGVYVYDSPGTVLTNNTLTRCRRGFILYLSSSCSLVNNTLVDSAIYLLESNSCNLAENVLTNGGVIIVGDNVAHWSHDMSDNLVNGKQLGYLVGLTNVTLDGSQYGQIVLVDCSDVTVRDAVLEHTSIGVQLGFSQGCVLTNVTVLGGIYGFYLYGSVSCALHNCTAVGNDYDGFSIDHSAQTVSTGNNATNNFRSGIAMWYSPSCHVADNTVRANRFGMMLSQSSYSTLVRNSVTDNDHYGVLVDACSGLTIYMNEFYHNGVENAWDDGSSNSWDDGVSVGNCWDDYQGTGTYSIPGSAGSVDHYPVACAISPPVLDHPADLEYEFGTTGHTIVWTPYDSNPDRYEIRRDGSTVESGYWNGSKIVLVVDGLPVGVYNYTVIVYDTYANWASDMVYVIVVDTTSPVIVGPDDMQYESGTTGHILVWEAWDPHPLRYEVYRNGSLVASDNWNGSNIQVSVDGLSPGAYNYTAVLNDIYNNRARDTVLVIVVDTTPPVIDSPEDVQYLQGTTGHLIVWTVWDYHPSRYEVYRNGSLVDSGDWDGSQIAVSIDGLTPGIYEYTIIVYDAYGNWVSDTVFVTVLASGHPTTDGQTLLLASAILVGLGVVLSASVKKFRRRA
ncbi:MAG: NosD domain-containing protein [Candidatus Thorarchaeota archaeon]